MAETKIAQAVDTNMTNVVTDYSPDFEDTGVGASETVYDPPWTQWNGYYQDVPELGALIDKKAMWVCGRGFTTDAKTNKLLSRIKGNGKDSIQSIFHNASRVKTINGDSFAEIIRDKAKRLINLKPLNPGMRIVANKKGTIIRYEIRNNTQAIQTFNPKDIFHLQWNRVADEFHGLSTIKKLKDVVESKKEAMNDMRTVFHRYVKPLIISYIDTDDPTEIADYKTKLDKAVENMENLILPKGTADLERMSVPQFSTLDPLPWMKYLERMFIFAEGMPSVIAHGDTDAPEAAAKIAYLSWETVVAWEQLWYEREIKLQLGLDLKFNSPPSIINDLVRDQSKDGSGKLKGEQDGKNKG